MGIIAETWQVVGGATGLAVVFGYLGKAWEARRKAKMEDDAARTAERKDTLTEWQEYAQKVEGDVAKRDTELAASRAEVVKANSVVGQLRIRLQSSRGRIALLTQALALRDQDVEPFVIQQMEIRAQAVLVTKPDGTITEAAPNIIAIIDYDQSELINVNVEKLIPKRFRDKHKVFMDRARDLSIPLDPKNVLPLIFLAKGGQDQPVNIRVRRTEEDGKVVRFSALVTERDESPEDGNGGSHSGDSGAFLKAGDPAGSETKEMPQIAAGRPAAAAVGGQGPAKGG